MNVLDRLGQSELEELTYPLLKVMGGRMMVTYWPSEHTWEALRTLPNGRTADTATVWELLQLLHRMGFLAGVEDRGDHVACGGLTQFGVAWVRVREGKSTFSIVHGILLGLVVSLDRLIRAHGSVQMDLIFWGSIVLTSLITRWVMRPKGQGLIDWGAKVTGRQAQTDEMVHALLAMLEGLNYDVPKNREHTWEKLKDLQKETSGHSIAVVRETVLALHRFGCFTSFEDRGDTFVCGGLSKVGEVRLSQVRPMSWPRRHVLALVILAFIWVVVRSVLIW